MKVEKEQLSAMTPKQMQIMEVILKGNPGDPDPIYSAADLDEILDRIPYKTTKDSMHFSIRALMRRGYVKKWGTVNRRGRRRSLIVPTKEGIEATRPPAPINNAPVVADIGDDESEELFRSLIK